MGSYCVPGGFTTRMLASSLVIVCTLCLCEIRPFLHLPIIVFRSGDTFLLFSRKAVVAQPPTLTPVTNNICPATMDPKNTGPVNGDECYFWRTTGCSFGDKCRNKHLPASKGVDKKPWQKTQLLTTHSNIQGSFCRCCTSDIQDFQIFQEDFRLSISWENFFLFGVAIVLLTTQNE